MARISPFVLLLSLTLACLAACGDGAFADTAAAAGADGVAGDGAALTADAEVASSPCQPNVTGCVDRERYVCNASGTGLDKKPCAAGQFCANGECVGCTTDKDCPDGEVCNVASVCKPDRLAIATTALASGLVGAPYKVELAATGGIKPYSWAIIAGGLPAGLVFDNSSGVLSGTPTAAWEGKITVEVKGQSEDVDDKEFDLKIVDAGLVITTASPLKSGTDGAPYSVTFKAQGGTAPYFWGIVGGATPGGLVLGADGTLAGTINGDGSFGFDIKVLDGSEPVTLKATKHFDLTVTLAPLDIVGAQQVDLFLVKLIVLPLIIVTSSIGVPYSAKLEATGGKKPYHWTEAAMPGAVKSFIKNSGVPKGLTLADDGTISGAVTDPSAVVTLDLGFLKGLGVNLPSVSGFFFSAQVADSQSPAKTKTALFIIPTVPIGGP